MSRPSITLFRTGCRLLMYRSEAHSKNFIMVKFFRKPHSRWGRREMKNGFERSEERRASPKIALDAKNSVVYRIADPAFQKVHD